jgi:hypothetical protein
MELQQSKTFNGIIPETPKKTASALAFALPESACL